MIQFLICTASSFIFTIPSINLGVEVYSLIVFANVSSFSYPFGCVTAKLCEGLFIDSKSSMNLCYELGTGLQVEWCSSSVTGRVGCLPSRFLFKSSVMRFIKSNIIAIGRQQLLTSLPRQQQGYFPQRLFWNILVSIIEIMFKYYFSRDYRKTYEDLSKLGMLSDSFSISFPSLLKYLSELVLNLNDIEQHLKILKAQKLTPMKVVKHLLFIHAWMQVSFKKQGFDQLFEFLDHILKASVDTATKIKANQLSLEKRGGKSAVFNTDMLSKEGIQFSKEVFLLEDVTKPYVLYLQKLVSVFAFYSSLKKNLFRTLETAQIWVLMNLFKCAYGVTLNVPVIYKFIRKSFKPIAEGISEAFSLDFNNFYPKLYRYLQLQSRRIQGRFDELERKYGEQVFKFGVEGLDDAVNLLQDVGQLGIELQTIYGDHASKGKNGVASPKLVDLTSEEFEFVFYLHKMRNSAELTGEPTPKFYKTHSSRPSMHTEGDTPDSKPELVPIFRDITNQEDNFCTFRKEQTSDRLIHSPNPFKRPPYLENSP